jgi:hypothetical protein
MMETTIRKSPCNTCLLRKTDNKTTLLPRQKRKDNAPAGIVVSTQIELRKGE